MCGRYTLRKPAREIAEAFEVPEVPELPARFNIAPTQDVPVVRLGDGGRQFELLHWGLIPSWADDPSNHAALASYLARPAYLGLPEEIIAAVLGGRLRFGLGAEVRDPDYLYFHRHAANAPREADGLWAYAQMVRWGQIAPSERAEKAAAMRPEEVANKPAVSIPV